MIYIVSIIVIVFLLQYVNNLSNGYLHANYQVNISYFIISFFLATILGGILGLDHFLKLLKMSGQWKINIPKLVIAGVPSLFFSLNYILYLSGIKFIQDIIIQIWENGVGYISVFQIVFGYIVITSFTKSSSQ